MVMQAVLNSVSPPAVGLSKATHYPFILAFLHAATGFKGLNKVFLRTETWMDEPKGGD